VRCTKLHYGLTAIEAARDEITKAIGAVGLLHRKNKTAGR